MNKQDFDEAYTAGFDDGVYETSELSWKELKRKSDLVDPLVNSLTQLERILTERKFDFCIYAHDIVVEALSAIERSKES